jgi:hypothetical protein
MDHKGYHPTIQCYISELLTALGKQIINKIHDTSVSLERLSQEITCFFIDLKGTSVFKKDHH